MQIRGALLFLGLLAIPLLARSAPCTPYTRLARLIENGNSFGVAPGIPEQLPVIANRSLGREYLKVAQKLWENVRPSDQLVAAYSAAADKGTVDARLLADSKALRARLKVIRALCDSICADHETPAILDDAIKTMGKFQDSATHGAAKSDIQDLAGRLRDAFSGKARDKLERAVADMKPAGRRENTDWLRGSMREMHDLLKKNDLSEDEFHEARKTLGRFQTLVLMDAINGNDKSAAAYEKIRRLYDDLGTAHDRMVEGAAKGEDEVPAAFSDDERAQLKEILKALKRGA